MKLKSTLLIIFIVNLILISFLVAADFEGSWPTFSHDLMHTGKSEFQGPDKPKLKLNEEISSCGLNPVIISSNRLFVTDTCGKLFALDKNGKVKWFFDTDSFTFSEAAVNDNVVYFNSYSGYLYALDAVKGNVLWQNYIGNNYVTSPVVANGLVYAQGWASGGLKAFYLNGTLKWQAWQHGDTMQTPALENGKLYIAGSNQKIVAYDADDGSLIWETLTPEVNTYGGSIVIGNHLYVPGNNNVLYALNKNTGAIEWSYNFGSDIEKKTAAIDGKRLYIATSDGYLYALIDNGGAIALDWTYYMGASSEWFAPAIDNKGNIYVTSNSTNVYGITKDGNLKWSFPFGGKKVSIDNNGLYYVSGKNLVLLHS